MSEIHSVFCVFAFAQYVKVTFANFLFRFAFSTNGRVTHIACLPCKGRTAEPLTIRLLLQVFALPLVLRFLSSQEKIV